MWKPLYKLKKLVAISTTQHPLIKIRLQKYILPKLNAQNESWTCSYPEICSFMPIIEVPLTLVFGITLALIFELALNLFTKRDIRITRILI